MVRFVRAIRVVPRDRYARPLIGAGFFVGDFRFTTCHPERSEGSRLEKCHPERSEGSQIGDFRFSIGDF